MDKKIIAYFLAFIALGMTTAVLGPTLPGLAKQTNSQLSGISFLFATRSLGFLLGALLAGRVYDRFPGHPVIAVALLFMSLSLMLIPLMTQLWLLTAVLFVAGVVESGVDVGSNTLLTWRLGDKVGPAMNGLHFFFGLGAFLSPIIIAQVMQASDGSIRQAYWILALIVLPTAFFFVRFPSVPIRQRKTAVRGEAVNWRLILLVAAFLFLYAGAEVSYGGWIFTYATALNLSNATNAAYLTSFFWGFLTVGRLLSIPLATRLSITKMLTGALAGSVLSVAALLVWQNSTMVLWMGTVALGLSMSLIFPMTISLAEQILSLSGKMASYFFVGAGLGTMLIPWLIGQQFEQAGFIVTMRIIFVTLLAAAGVFSLIYQQAKVFKKSEVKR